jgi:formylglycine-generating enzyme required for sulfatase activity
MPLSVGGGQHTDIVIPDVEDGTRVAHIAIADGHAFIQPDDVALPLFHNHERMLDSVWLKSGDQVQLGDSALHWNVKGDQVFISVGQVNDAPQLTPPQSPAPSVAAEKTALPAADVPVSLHGQRRLRRVFAGLFVLLVAVAAFVLLATPLVLRITPEPELQSVRGFPPPVSLGGRLLALPGLYTVHAKLDGYHDLEQALDISLGGFREYSFKMQELPGHVMVHVEPDVAFELFVDDQPMTTDSAGVAKILRGMHRLRVQTERYLTAEQQLDITGLGKDQQVLFSLQPAWADVQISSQPVGAGVSVEGRSIGSTPLEAEILQGVQTIVLSLKGYKPVVLQQEITAGSTLQLKNIELPPADGRLVLQSTPSVATISVDGKFLGTTPATLTLSSGQLHRLQLSKPGYRNAEQELTLGPDEEQALSVTLPPEYGTLFITSSPADARLVLDGKAVGEANRRLRLTTRPHSLEFSKAGYITQRIKVTPRAGVSQNLDIRLKTVAQAKADAIPVTLTTAGGQLLRLVRPAGARFRMGASRREAGRRANESRRLVQLTRPFYLGESEVTNSQYRRFRPSHSSGNSEGAALDGESQPVVKVSWDDAARYCNWLSKKDGLPAAYREKGGSMQTVRPMTTGYRLSTEAEWAYVARVMGRDAPQRYPWSGSFPPTAVVGNFADAQISDTLADVVPAYDDRYRGTAPVGSFTAYPAGFNDLGGNVAEWNNDFYALYPGESERLVKDPVGPVSGEHYVVRGSSWRHGNITELRLSYRDYSREVRSDLGFRIARYAE